MGQKPKLLVEQSGDSIDNSELIKAINAESALIQSVYKSARNGDISVRFKGLCHSKFARSMRRIEYEVRWIDKREYGFEVCFKRVG